MIHSSQGNDIKHTRLCELFSLLLPFAREAHLRTLLPKGIKLSKGCVKYQSCNTFQFMSKYKIIPPPMPVVYDT